MGKKIYLAGLCKSALIITFLLCNTYDTHARVKKKRVRKRFDNIRQSTGNFKSAINDKDSKRLINSLKKKDSSLDASNSYFRFRGTKPSEGLLYKASNIVRIASIDSLNMLFFVEPAMTNYSPLKHCKKLSRLCIERPNNFQLNTLGQLSQLQFLMLAYANELYDLTPLRGLKIKELRVKHCTNLQSLDGVEALQQLRIIRLPAGFNNLEPLSNLPNLREIYVGGKLVPMQKVRKNYTERKQQEEETEAVDVSAIAKELQFSSADVQKHLVIVDCGNKVGSGFVAKDGEKTYVYTNQHVVSGADSVTLKTLDGRTLKTIDFSYSEERDICRFRVAELEALTMNKKQPEIGEAIAVYGNSAGGGVVTQLFGRVNGVGPDRVEVSAQFVKGNSGSPMVDKDMNVVGIATYVSKARADIKWINAGTRFNKVRRFGYRLNNIKWKTSDWENYKKITGRLNSVEEYNKNILNIVVKLSVNPFQEITCETSYPSDLAKWVKAHNRFVQRFWKGKNNIEDYSTLKKFKKEISRKAEQDYTSLSKLCIKVSGKMTKSAQKSKDKLTKYQYEQVVGAASSVDYIGKHLITAGKNIIHSRLLN